MTARRTVTLRYMTEFACIGDKCEETCCGGTWSIGVDKAHFVALEKLLTPREIEDGFELAPADYNVPGMYARMKKELGESCRFLDGSWCSIHKRFGVDALPDTCAQYPRRVSVVGER